MSISLSEKQLNQVTVYFNRMPIESKEKLVEKVLDKRRESFHITMTIKRETLEKLTLDKFVKDYYPTLHYKSENKMLVDIYRCFKELLNEEKTVTNTKTYPDQYGESGTRGGAKRKKTRKGNKLYSRRSRRN